jgi:outer membrane protein assembly factor BamB
LAVLAKSPARRRWRAALALRDRPRHRGHPDGARYLNFKVYYGDGARPEVLHAAGAMGLMDFIKKQFIDIIQWTEDDDGTLAWRFPMAEMEIQNGASLTVRESQMAVFVNEGTVADVFGPGMYKLTTQTLPVLTYLKNWDKLFESPFKSDVYFFSTRQKIDQQVGHAEARDHPRQGFRHGAPARLRQLQLSHRRPQAVPHRNFGHA